MKTEINSKTGKLTSYGFACGYQESKTNSKGGFKKIWRESGVYHVAFRYFTNSLKAWESFTKLNEARKLYDSIQLD